MTIKLYEARSPKIETAPKPGQESVVPMAWPPPLPPQPFADSEASFDVKQEEPYAEARGRYGVPQLQRGMRLGDPRPFELPPSEGTMQQDPKGYESEWGKTQSGAEMAKPFVIKK